MPMPSVKCSPCLWDHTGLVSSEIIWRHSILLNHSLVPGLILAPSSYSPLSFRTICVHVWPSESEEWGSLVACESPWVCRKGSASPGGTPVTTEIPRPHSFLERRMKLSNAFPINCGSFHDVHSGKNYKTRHSLQRYGEGINFGLISSAIFLNFLPHFPYCSSREFKGFSKDNKAESNGKKIWPDKKKISIKY